MRKVVLLTGVRRIGRFLAEALLKEGYDLGVVYRESGDTVKYLRELGTKVGGRVLPLQADLRDPLVCGKLVEKTCEELGRIDAFVHLASPYLRTPVGRITPEEIQEHFGPIAEAFVLIAQEAYLRMMENDGEVRGHILAFGDWAAEHTPYRGFTAYFISKGALHTAVKVLAREFAPHVLVNCIALGPVLRPEDTTPASWRRILKNTPLGREVSLEDIVELSLFLLRTRSVTGEVIRLDGGRHLAGSGGAP